MLDINNLKKKKNCQHKNILIGNVFIIGICIIYLSRYEMCKNIFVSHVGIRFIYAEIFFYIIFFLSMHKTLNDGNGMKIAWIILNSKMEKLFIKAYY